MQVKCMFCFKELTDSDNIYLTKCSHIYHHQCMQQWRSGSGKCSKCLTEQPESFRIQLESLTSMMNALDILNIDDIKSIKANTSKSSNETFIESMFLLAEAELKECKKKLETLEKEIFRLCDQLKREQEIKDELLLENRKQQDKLNEYQSKAEQQKPLQSGECTKTIDTLEKEILRLRNELEIQQKTSNEVVMQNKQEQQQQQQQQLNKYQSKAEPQKSNSNGGAVNKQNGRKNQRKEELQKQEQSQIKEEHRQQNRYQQKQQQSQQNQEQRQHQQPQLQIQNQFQNQKNQQESTSSSSNLFAELPKVPITVNQSDSHAKCIILKGAIYNDHPTDYNLILMLANQMQLYMTVQDIIKITTIEKEPVLAPVPIPVPSKTPTNKPYQRGLPAPVPVPVRYFKIVLMVMFRTEDIREKFLKNRNMLMLNPMTKRFGIYKYYSEDTNSLLQYAKVLKGYGYFKVFTDNNMVFAKKDKSSEIIRIRDKEHVAEIKKRCQEML